MRPLLLKLGLLPYAGGPLGVPGEMSAAPMSPAQTNTEEKKQ